MWDILGQSFTCCLNYFFRDVCFQWLFWKGSSSHVLFSYSRKIRGQNLSTFAAPPPQWFFFVPIKSEKLNNRISRLVSLMHAELHKYRSLNSGNIQDQTFFNAKNLSIHSFCKLLVNASPLSMLFGFRRSKTMLCLVVISAETCEIFEVKDFHAAWSTVLGALIFSVLSKWRSLVTVYFLDFTLMPLGEVTLC